MATTTTRHATWNNIGKTINTTDIQEALQQGNLDYEVSLQTISTMIGTEQVIIPNKHAIVRNDGHIYNVVSDKYMPFQNRDAFDFIKYINEDITFIKAGETNSGLIYIIGHIKEMNILGDKFNLYVIFQTSHNAKYKLSMTVCPLRLICENQFNIAFKESNSTFEIKHCKNIESKMSIATNTLHTISDYIKVFEEKANVYATAKLSNSQISQFLNYMFPIKEDLSDIMKTRLEEQKSIFLKAYNYSDNNNFKGTAWGLINGLTDYITHKSYQRKVENVYEKKFIETIAYANELNNSIQFLNSVI